MADASRLAADGSSGLLETWRRLNFEQRVAATAALLLIASSFGPFSFVEAALVLTAGGVLALLKQRADRKSFHLPFGDGTVIFTAGLWSGFLIVVRLFDRPLGQSVLALVCAAMLAGAGARERAKRPADDLAPPAPRPPPRERLRRDERSASEAETARLARHDAPTERVGPAAATSEPAAEPRREADGNEGDSPPRPEARP